MDISDTNILIPWKNLHECEQLLKSLVHQKFDPIKRRQLLIQLQWLTNISDEYRSQLFQTILKCCHATYKDEFLRNLNQTIQYILCFIKYIHKKEISE